MKLLQLLKTRTTQRAMRFVGSAALVLIAYLVRYEMYRQFQLMLPVYITFYPAVILASISLGLWPALFSVVFSALIVDLYVLPPVHHFFIQSPSDIAGLVFFASINITICLITDRMRRYERRLAVMESDAALQESRNLLHLFIEHAPTSVAMFDLEMRYLTASEVWCREYNLLRTDILGRSHYEIFPEISDQWKEAHRRGLSGECVCHDKDLLMRADGSMHWLRWEIRPWKRYSGDVGGIIIFSEDITPQVESETVLDAERAKFQLAMASAPDAICIADTDGKILDFNLAFALYYKYKSKEECANALSAAGDADNYGDLLDVYDPQGNLVFVDQWPIRRAIRGEVGKDIVLHLYRKDTSENWTGSYNFGPIRDRTQKIIGAVVSIRDITETKHAMEMLAKSEMRFRRLFEENTSVFLLIEPITGHIIDANHSAAAFFGYDRATLRNMYVEQLMTDSKEALAEHHRRVLNGDVESVSRTLRLASGNLREVELFASPIENNGRKAVFMVAWDVTDARKTEVELRHREELYRTAFLTSLDAILISEQKTGRIIDSNMQFRQLLNFSGEELIGKTTLELGLWVHPEARLQMLERLKYKDGFRDFEFSFYKRNKDVRIGIMSARMITIGDEQCIHSVVRDITDEKHAIEAIRNSEERYRTAFQTSMDAISINRVSDGVFIDVNQRYSEITGYEYEDVVGKSSLKLDIWVDLRDREVWVSALNGNGACYNFQTKFRRKNGDLIWAMVSSSLISLSNEDCVLSIVRDVTDVKLAEEQIRSLAYFDPLTGLANRRLVLERLQQHSPHTTSVESFRVILLIDLDDFRMLNDARGHTFGDQILREAGMRITSCAREATTVARSGSDEFIVLFDMQSDNLEDAGVEAGKIAICIQQRMEWPFLIEGREANLSCSIGITVFAEREENSSIVMQQADMALSQAKLLGHGTIRFFAPEMQAAVDARSVLVEDLRLGIRLKQFVLYYQPQFAGSRLIGAEALVRWNHPQRGLLGPGSFIQLAEETRMIVPLGEWILEDACREIVRLEAFELDESFHVAVNISALEMLRPDFIERVLATLRRTGANPRHLQIEITESVLMENTEAMIAKLNALKIYGIQFSIDDFGTGFSSLAYLKRLPLDQLKIDMSFVRDVATDASSRAIVQTIISLGQAMNLSVIAEGVEDERQQEVITELGCHSFQGYLFGRPVPVSEFEGSLRNKGKDIEKES